jgi:4'-phosphopantetheinyl transferase
VSSEGPQWIGVVCSVWWATPSDRPALAQLLDDSEREHAARLRKTADRRRYITAHALARVLIAPSIGLSPDAIRFDTTCPRCGADHGKPRLGGDGGAVPVSFSLAHGGNRVVVAITDGAPVGVDVEPIRRMSSVELLALSADVMTPGEQASYSVLPVAERPRAMAVTWTRKEAVLKVWGEGLSVPPSQLSVSHPYEAPAVTGWGIHGTEVQPQARAPVTLRDLDAGAGYVASLAVLGAEPVHVSERDADPLL